PLLALIRQCQVNALCHITGGGFIENLPRVLPENCAAVLDLASYRRPALFDWLQRSGNVDSREMYRVFNCGIGMVVCVPAAAAEQALALLRAAGEEAAVIGTIEPLADGAERVQLRGL